MLVSILVNWVPQILIVALFVSLIYGMIKLVNRIDRALPDRDRD